MAADRARKPRSGPRGEALDAIALAEVTAALGDMPRRPDMMIEALHAVQDRFGAIRRTHLRALAEAFGVPHVVPYEAATFYAHFDLVDDQAEPPPETIRVCTGLPCALAGASAHRERLSAAHRGARVLDAPCMGQCDRAPAHEHRHAAFPLPAPRGYDALAAAPDDPEALAAVIERAGLRGMGGAGFPAARKWRLVRANPGPRHLVVNADEGEPGTFKDLWCLERDIHRVLEGMLIAARAVEAEACWIYLRDEYRHLFPALRQAIADIPAGAFGGAIHLRRGAGA